MDGVLFALTLATAVAAGLVGGVFFAFSNFVMRALGRIPAHEGIRAMQEINVTVIHRGFMTALFGTGLASLAVIVVALADWEGSYGPYLVAAGAVYVAGTVGVTMALNVPRNQALARVEPSSGEGAAVWGRYLVEWTRWNSVRTVASLATTAALMAGIAAS
jgi:uncharacterized membrane protein